MAAAGPPLTQPVSRPASTAATPNIRARILDRAHASVSVDIHADYAPSSGRGFRVLGPVADGPNDKVITSSLRFGRDVHAAMTLPG